MNPNHKNMCNMWAVYIFNVMYLLCPLCLTNALIIYQLVFNISTKQQHVSCGFNWSVSAEIFKYWFNIQM